MPLPAGREATEEIDLAAGRLRYRDEGSGPPVVFVHGLLVNSGLWRGVIPGVAAAGFRCLAPDWPLGAHEIAVPDADLSPPGVAAMIADFLDRLDLTGVTVVANDTGGALTQLLMVEHPDRVAAVVLTPSDCFECFLPPMFTPLIKLSHVPGAVWLFVQLLRIRALHRLPFAFGRLTKRPMSAEVTDSYLGPSRRDPAIRADLGRFLRGIHKRHTLAAAQRLPRFTRPVLLAWAAEDRLFRISLAHRLARVLPNATVVPIADCYTFVPEDQPVVLTQLITQFADRHAAT